MHHDIETPKEGPKRMEAGAKERTTTVIRHRGDRNPVAVIQACNGGRSPFSKDIVSTNNSSTMTTTTYRPLFMGDLIEDGDEWQDPRTGQWHEAHVTGRTVGTPGRTNYDYRRPVMHVQPMAAGMEVMA